MEKKLYRDEHHKTIGGVCAGLAEYFNMDVSVVRVIFVLGIFVKGVAILPYFILWAVLPKRPFNYTDPTFKPGVTPGFNPKYGHGFGDVHVDYTVPPPPMPGQPFTPYPPAKKTSNVGVMFGIILIALGTIFLLDQFEFIPDFDFEKLWPVILVAIGATLIFTGKKKPWEKEGWHAEKKEADFSADTKTEATDEQSNDNTPTV